MALVLADRVRETTTVTGTGTATLLGAVSGYQSFAAVGNANTTYYVIANQSASEWEVGIGTYTSSGTTLSRDTVLSSSNSGSLVNFSAGTKDVFVDYPASKAVYEDASDIVTGYAITGGAINNTTVGATTPAAGTFTTLTAQTEVLKGTGQNLLTYSNTFNNVAWTQTFLTATTTVATTDPFGASNAWILTEDTTTNQRYITRAFSCVNGSSYTLSVYAKANTRSFVYISNFDTLNRRAWFNLSTGSVGTTDAGVTASITSVGNGWYRCSITTTLTASTTYPTIGPSNADGVVTYLGNGSSIYLYGSQYEIGSTLNTYIPTTTTAVYGTPTLSFSGVSTIGLQSDGSLYVSPAGTGALQAQATTSSATGGNARGINAIDWQTGRDVAAQVASGAYSVISGGYGNRATSTYSATLSGGANINSCFQGVIAGGTNNQISSLWSGIFSGNSNVANGYYNFIGGGWTNSATSSSAVTTQSATMNATTAVTLSGSNANIKVGQYISGTSISNNTYVAAISGTSLTLSQAASGSSTSTLSFYTPHGVVVGGGNNQATGSYSFIGGGGDAGSSVNRNVASGDWSFVGGGRGNQATGIGAFIGGGGYDGGVSVSPHTASGQAAFIGGGLSNFNSGYAGVVAGGFSNTASNTAPTIGGGAANTANANYSAIMGGFRGTTRSVIGNHVFPACNDPITTTAGVSQSALLVLGRETTNATATVLTSNASAASGTNQVILPNNSAYYFKGSVIANVTGGGNTKGWSIEGVIKRGANAASTAIVGTATVMSSYADVGAATWAITATADTTNGGLAITFTGQASTTIRVVAKLETTEVTF